MPRELTGAEPAVGIAPAALAGVPNIGDALASTERDMMLAALRDAGGHKGQAAERLGISRHAFKRRLQQLGIG